MAVFETLRSLFVPSLAAETEMIVPAAPCVYRLRPLTLDHLPEVLRLNIRCFRKGDNYTKYTFDYLLNEPNTLSYRMDTPKGEMVGFAFVMAKDNNSGHITTIGVAPEHRRRGIGERLVAHLEAMLRAREVNTIVLEVKVGNVNAQRLYRRAGFMAVQRIGKYYSNGEDCFLMMKALL